MIELELTYLAKSIPEGVKEGKEMLDIYIPKSAHHPILRIRKNGDKYEMTKKSPVKDGDSSVQKEHTILLTKEEFKELSQLEGKRVSKTRYIYNHNGRNAEIDVFHGELKGLVLVDFEFDSEEEKENFEIPDFCLAEVTQEKFLAGGMLCGKNYGDIEKNLERYGYKRLQ